MFEKKLIVNAVAIIQKQYYQRSCNTFKYNFSSIYVAKYIAIAIIAVGSLYSYTAISESKSADHKMSFMHYVIHVAIAI